MYESGGLRLSPHFKSLLETVVSKTANQSATEPPSAETDSQGGRMEHTISTKNLKGKLDRNESIKVVETLAPERYREAHLPGALNIPPDKIKELAPQVLPNKDAEIVTYCTNTH
jgi:rhodanese-like protein